MLVTLGVKGLKKQGNMASFQGVSKCFEVGVNQKLLTVKSSLRAKR